MIVPVLNKSYVVVVFCGVLENHPDFAPEGVEQLLLLDLASKCHMHAIMVFLDQFC